MTQRMNPNVTKTASYTPKESFDSKYQPYLYEISKEEGYALNLAKYNKDNPL